MLREIFDLVFALDEDPSTPATKMLHKAVRYVVRQRSPLLAHLDNVRVLIHNNDTERHLRHVVTGRKNWQTFASKRGGQAANQRYSQVTSCELAKTNVEAHLEDVLASISTMPLSRVAELTPWGGAEARAAELPKGSPHAAIRRGRQSPASAS